MAELPDWFIRTLLDHDGELIEYLEDYPFMWEIAHRHILLLGHIDRSFRRVIQRDDILDATFRRPAGVPTEVALKAAKAWLITPEGRRLCLEPGIWQRANALIFPELAEN